MKNFKNIFIAGAIVAILTSCSVTMPVTVSDAKIGAKRGVSTSTILFNVIYLNSNYGIGDAAKNGGITSAIATVDKKITNYLIFQKVELIVTGE
jgi:hypothetical protein